MDFVGLKVHFKPDIGQVSHDIGQVMILVTFILTGPYSGSLLRERLYVCADGMKDYRICRVSM